MGKGAQKEMSGPVSEARKGMGEYLPFVGPMFKAKRLDRELREDDDTKWKARVERQIEEGRAVDKANTITEIDKRDADTPDKWIPRHPELIRLTGRHPFNCEPPLPLLLEKGKGAHC